MDKFPLMQGCFSVGELITEQEALEDLLRFSAKAPEDDLSKGRYL